MKILVLGTGGREHALLWKLAQESEVIAAPGNPGMAQICPVFAVDPCDHAAVIHLAKTQAVDLVVIGPEDPLIDGLADSLRAQGVATFGPGREGAQLEGSKAFSKSVMQEAGIPTAAFTVVTTFAEAERVIQSRFDKGKQVAVKASGAALGKGVVVCSNPDEATDAARMMLSKGSLGDAGRTVVIEDRLMGFEFSLLTLVSEAGIWSLPIAQDYKRIFDHDAGPNTGGMGTYSPVPHVPADLVAQSEAQIVLPLIQHLKRKNIRFRGVLFSGVMVENGIPLCLEYNVRFGDPETQTVLRRLEAGLADALYAVAKGGVPPPIPLASVSAVTVVLASRGYPQSSEKGVPIQLGSVPPEVVLFHAGTATSDGTLVTAGGRVIGVSAVGESIASARHSAYQACEQITFDGMQFRKDIGLLA